MSTPAKTPKPKIDAAWRETFLLYIRNKQEMAAWYRRQAHPGPELGIHVTMEISHADDANAAVLAIEGKSWEPPNK